MPRNDDNSRMVKLSPDDIREIATRLKKAAASFNGVANAMESKGTASVEVDGSKMLERGFDSIAGFLGNCQKGVREF